MDVDGIKQAVEIMQQVVDDPEQFGLNPDSSDYLAKISKDLLALKKYTRSHTVGPNTSKAITRRIKSSIKWVSVNTSIFVEERDLMNLQLKSICRPLKISCEPLDGVFDDPEVLLEDTNVFQRVNSLREKCDSLVFLNENARSELDNKLDQLKTKHSAYRVTCFVSYSRTESHETTLRVYRFVLDLLRSGVKVVFDKTQKCDTAASLRKLVQTISVCHFSILIGAPTYQEKDRSFGAVIGAEADQLWGRYISVRDRVFRLKFEGGSHEAFPDGFDEQSTKYVDFQDNSQYEKNLLKVIDSLYRGYYK